MGKRRQPSKQNGRIQGVLNAPRYIREPYLSPKGVRLLNELKEAVHSGIDYFAQYEEIWRKYGKNRLIPNPECTHYVKVITHSTILPDEKRPEDEKQS